MSRIVRQNWKSSSVSIASSFLANAQNARGMAKHAVRINSPVRPDRQSLMQGAAREAFLGGGQQPDIE